MSKILLSIEPQFVERILEGTKCFEFRKIRTKNSISKIIIYSTSPVMKVVAEADVVETLIDNPEAIWEITRDWSGISKEYFDSYFEGKQLAVAYRLKNVQKYEEPVELIDLGILHPPQSFVYLNDAV